MRALGFLLLVFLSFLLASENPTTSKNQVDGVGEVVSHHLLDQFKIIKDETLQVIKEVFEASPENQIKKLLVPLKSCYLRMGLWLCQGSKGTLSPFIIYCTIDKYVSEIIFMWEVTETTQGTFRPSFTDGFKFKEKAAVRIAEARENINKGGMPMSLRLLVHKWLDVQSESVSEMNLDFGIYLGLFRLYYGESGIERLSMAFAELLMVSRNLPSSTFQEWAHLAGEMERHYYKFIIAFYETGVIPADASSGFILVMARMDFKFGPLVDEIDLFTRAREHHFQIYHSRLSDSSYLKSKTMNNLVTLPAQLSKSNWHTANCVQFSLTRIELVRESLTKHWEKHSEKVQRTANICFLFGIEYIEGSILEIASILFPKNPIKKDPLSQVTRMLQIYGLSVELLKRLITPFAPQSLIKKLVNDGLDFPKNLICGFSNPIYIIFDSVELIASDLYPKDDIFATAIFRYLEFCRSMAFLSEALLAPYKMINLFSSAMCLPHFCESQDYLFHAVHENFYNITGMTADNARDLSITIMTALNCLISREKWRHEMSDHFYKYLQAKCKANPKSTLWKNIAYGARDDFARIERKEREAAEAKKKEEQKVKEEPSKSRITKSKHVAEPKPGKKKRRAQRAEAAARKLQQEKIDNEAMPIRVIGAEKSALIPVQKVVPPPEASSSEDSNEFLALESGEMKAENEPHSKEIVVSHRPSVTKVLSKPVKMITNGVQSAVEMYSRPPRRAHSYYPQPKRLALTYKDLEPTHHTVSASLLGYQEGSSVDPRDYLMAHILIGQRIWTRIIQPLKAALKPYEWDFHLLDSFDHSIDTFKNDLLNLRAFDSRTVERILSSAGVPDFAMLMKCLDYYHKRMRIAHPMIPVSKKIRDFALSRHLTVLEKTQSIDVVMMSKMRANLECYGEVNVKPVEKVGRPSDLLSSEDSEIALAIFWVHNVYPKRRIDFVRNKYAHLEVTDTIYHSYIDYVFNDHPDHGFLYNL